MKRAEYKLNGDVPEVLKGAVIMLAAAETLDDLRQQVKDGADEHIVSAGQSSIDITKQRLLRSKAGSEEIADILNGKADGTADLSPEDRKAAAVQSLQTYIDGYIYGSRPQGTGETAKIKKSAKVGEAVVAAAVADPEFAKRMLAMGIELPTEVVEQLRAAGHAV